MEISAVDRRRVQGLVRELEEAGSVGEFRERAVRGLMELVSADAAQSYLFPVDGATVSALSIPGESFHEDPATMLEHPLDHPLTEAMLTVTGPEARRVSDVSGDLQWRRTHCYRLDFRPFGLRRHLMAWVRTGGADIEGYALARSGADFSERDRDILGFAQPQLATVERRVRQHERLLALTALALELVGSPGRGVATLGGDGAPQPLNPAAEALLPVVRDDPRLGTGDFTARQVEVRYVAPVAPGMPALLLLRDLARGRATARRLQVTEQEYRTLLHIDAGLAADDAARAMRLSSATVRGYIASLHRKLDVRHTAALLRRARDLGLLD